MTPLDAHTWPDETVASRMTARRPVVLPPDQWLAGGSADAQSPCLPHRHPSDCTYTVVEGWNYCIYYAKRAITRPRYRRPMRIPKETKATDNTTISLQGLESLPPPSSHSFYKRGNIHFPKAVKLPLSLQVWCDIYIHLCISPRVCP